MSFDVESPVDVFALFRGLAEVDFVVIGGIAVARHGFVRATKDVDVVPDPARDNLDQLFRALQPLGASPLELQDFRPEEIAVALSAENLALGGNWAFSTKYGRLDVMQYIDGALETVEDYERLRSAAVESRFDFGIVRFVGYEELIDLKMLAGRDLDLTDVRALREARQGTGE